MGTVEEGVPLTAAEVVRRADQAQLRLWVEGDKLRIEGKASPEVDTVIAMIRQLRGDVIELVKGMGELDLTIEEQTLDPVTADLTLFVGALVTEEWLEILMDRCKLDGYALDAQASGKLWYITRLAKPRTYGTINVGKPGKVGHYHYVISAGHPLYRGVNQSYKRWLWDKMKEDGEVVHALYVILNGAYVGADVYIDGPNAEVVKAAALYLLKDIAFNTQPLLQLEANKQ